MQCRKCGYSLFNLSEPRCPECGTGFDLRTYRFRPGTVGFACPYCGHLHGGMGQNYVPSETDAALCLGCNRQMSVGGMRVVPMIDQVENCTFDDLLPWEQRETVGVWRGFWRTWGMGIGLPMRLGRLIQRDEGLGRAWQFAAVISMVGIMPTAIATAAFYLWMTRYGMGQSSPRTWVDLGWMIGGYAGAAVVWPLLVVVHAALVHLILRMSGPTDGGIGRTIRCLWYSQSPILLLGVLPCFGPFCFGWIMVGWLGIAAIFVVSAAQKVGDGRAALACLPLPVLVCLAWPVYIAIMMSH